MAAAKSVLDRGQPEVPIFIAKTHSFVEADTGFENAASNEATGLANVRDRMRYDIVGPGMVPIKAEPEIRYVWIEPIIIRLAGDRAMKRFDRKRQKAIIRIQEKEGLAIGKICQDKINPPIPSPAQTAVFMSNVVNVLKCLGQGTANGDRLKVRAAIIHNDDIGGAPAGL